MSTQEYQVEVEGTIICVSEYEITRVFGEMVRAESVNIQRARMIAERKVISRKCNVVADTGFYVGLLMAGEHKTGESIYFRVSLSEEWNVVLTREEDGRYGLFAFCLSGKYEDYNRCFANKEAAILFCANRFNRNVTVSNLYMNGNALYQDYTKKFDYSTREEAMAKYIERGVNDYNFSGKKFSECIPTMHPTLQQNFFRYIIKESILFMADSTNHHIDGRNQASHDISVKLAEVLKHESIPFI